MYVFPVDTAATLPAVWARYAKVAPKPFTVAAGRDRAEPRRLAARVERHHHADEPADEHGGHGPGSSALAALPLVVARGASSSARSPGMVGRGFCAGRAPRPRRRSLEVLGRPPGAPGAVVHGLVGRRWRPSSTVLLGLPVAFVLHRLRFPGRGLLRAFVLVPFVLPTVVVGVAFRTLLAPSGPLGGLRPRRHPGRDRRRAWCSSTSPSWCAPSARSGRASTGAARRPRPRWAPRPLQVLRTVTLPALLPGDRLGGQRGVPVLRHRVRRRAHAGRAALRHRRDRDLPAHHPVPRPAGPRPRCRCSSCVVVTVLLYVAQRTRSRPRARRSTAPASATPPAGRGGATCRCSRSPRWRWRFVAAPLLTLLRRARCGSAARWGSRTTAPSRTTGAAARCWSRSSDGARRTPGGSRSTPPCSRCCSACWSSLAVSRRPRARAGRRRGWRVLDAVFMLPLGVSAVTLGLRVPGHPRPAAAGPAQLGGAGADRAGDGRAAAGGADAGAGAAARSTPRQRQAAASLGASPLRVLLTVDLPVAVAAAARRDRLRVRGLARRVRRDQLPGPAGPPDPAGGDLPADLAARGARTSAWRWPPRWCSAWSPCAVMARRRAAPARVRGSVLRCSTDPRPHRALRRRPARGRRRQPRPARRRGARGARARPAAGKSTLLRAVAGLERARRRQRRATTAQDLAAGTHPPARLRADVPGRPAVPAPDVAGNVGYPLRLRRTPRTAVGPAGRGAARAGRPARLRRPAAHHAVRRRAAAGRAGPGAGRRAAAAAARRAALRARPGAARAAGRRPARHPASPPAPRRCWSPTTRRRRSRSPTGWR